MGKPSKEFQEFDSLMDRLLTVPKSTIHERHAEHKKEGRAQSSQARPETEGQAAFGPLCNVNARRSWRRCLVRSIRHTSADVPRSAE